jgi:catechol 2,3-dioxygenase-like lactoylglutathione lyase family enzyme
MITQIRHTGLVVRNLEIALHFWRDILGFRVAKQMDESGPHIDAMMGLKDVRVTTVKLVAPDGGMIELLYFLSHPDSPRWSGKPHSTGFTHVAMTVTKLDDFYHKLMTEGVTFFAPPQLSLDGSVKVTYCQGPEGVMLELVEILQT